MLPNYSFMCHSLLYEYTYTKSFIYACTFTYRISDLINTTPHFLQIHSINAISGEKKKKKKNRILNEEDKVFLVVQDFAFLVNSH